MRLYKLTDENSETLNGTKWEIGKTVSLPHKNDPKLCTGDLLHAGRYANSLLALNYIHRNFINPILWEVEGEIDQESWDQVGSFALTPIKKLEIPLWYKRDDYKHEVYANFMHNVAFSVRDMYMGTAEFESALSAIDDYFESADESKRNNANAKFRTLLHETYKLYIEKRKGAELGFILYLDAFCRLDPSYLSIHVGTMYESACTVGLSAVLILQNSIEDA